MLEIDKISSLLADGRVTDILISSRSMTQIEVSGQLTEIEAVFEDESELRSWVQRLFSNCGGRLDLSQPLGEVSVSTEYGILRIHAVLAGECSPNTQVSIRRHPKSFLLLQDLYSANSL